MPSASAARPAAPGRDGTPSTLLAAPAGCRPAAGRALVGPPDEGERRADEDQQVGLPVMVAHVPEVELDALRPRQRGAAVDLGPAGDPRLDVEPVPLPFVVLLDLIAKRRTRPDHGHVAAYDVPELRDLVERD